MVCGYRDCNCGRDSNKVIEFDKISDSRTLLRCVKCGGIIGWIDGDDSKTTTTAKKKITPPIREWNDTEKASMK